MNHLKAERKQRGWRVSYVAEQCGVADEKTIRRWERGEVRPNPASRERLCRLFGMSLSELGLDQ